MSFIANIEWTFYEFRNLLKGRDDEVIVYAERIDKIEKHLPDEAAIGYYANRYRDKSDREKYFYLTQYELAPMMVLRNLEEAYLLLDINADFDLGRFCMDNNMQVYHDSGDGMLLLRKDDPIH